MIKINSNLLNIEVLNIEALDRHLKFVETMLLLKNNKKFQKDLQQWVLDTVISITDLYAVGGTTNDLEISEYRENHKIREADDGFILYNDTKIPADKYATLPFDTSGYPDGQFNIALAFEYGTGLVGTNPYGESVGYTYNNVENSKSKNHKRLVNEWYLPTSVNDKSGIRTAGYGGFEIYRKTAEYIKKELPKWLNDYIKKEVHK